MDQLQLFRPPLVFLRWSIQLFLLPRVVLSPEFCHHRLQWKYLWHTEQPLQPFVSQQQDEQLSSPKGPSRLPRWYLFFFPEMRMQSHAPSRSSANKVYSGQPHKQPHYLVTANMVWSCYPCRAEVFEWQGRVIENSRLWAEGDEELFIALVHLLKASGHKQFLKESKFLPQLKINVFWGKSGQVLWQGGLQGSGRHGDR